MHTEKKIQLIGEEIQDQIMLHLNPRQLLNLMQTCKAYNKMATNNKEYFVRTAALLVFGDIFSIGGSRLQFMLHTNDYKKDMDTVIDIINKQIAYWVEHMPEETADLWASHVNAPLEQKIRIKLLHGVAAKEAVPVEQVFSMPIKQIIVAHLPTIRSIDPVNAKKLLKWVYAFAAVPIPTDVKTRLANDLSACLTCNTANIKGSVTNRILQVVKPPNFVIPQKDLVSALEVVVRPGHFREMEIKPVLRTWALDFYTSMPYAYMKDLANQLRECLCGTIVGSNHVYLGRKELLLALAILGDASDPVPVVESDSNSEPLSDME